MVTIIGVFLSLWHLNFRNQCVIKLFCTFTHLLFPAFIHSLSTNKPSLQKKTVSADVSAEIAFIDSLISDFF